MVFEVILFSDGDFLVDISPPVCHYEACETPLLTKDHGVLVVVVCTVCVVDAVVARHDASCAAFPDRDLESREIDLTERTG